ncbi:beta-1,3-galactosyltransferase 6 [Anthonomus grandis grandis]|uniref:beta-1,3-galactosyltransferase 6 n=1 Tax=Anthonomus grandis grandis TaxID=2921223 RepID=UPI002166A317|nr:beta-1,3-galactosyltransferase 6 [Anthonomus grandis grandis]
MIKYREIKNLRTLLIALFSFLLGCMVTINLTPVEKTCIIDKSDREYRILQNSRLQNPEVIVLILSAPKHIEKRKVIRETWLNLGQITSTPYRFKHYFVVGSLGLDSDQLLHLSNEQSEFWDILILPMQDNYMNLTKKVLQMFQWLNDQYNYGLQYKFALKCDDDTFINLPALLKDIQNMEHHLATSQLQFPLNLPPEQLNRFITVDVQSNEKVQVENMSLYWGYFAGNSKVQTFGKWAEPHWIACDKYVPYALGGGYILSKELVSFIARNADNLRVYNSEDVSVGLWLAPVNNIIRIHDIRFDTEWTTRGCKDFYLVTHNIPPDDMRNMYDSLQTDKRLCKKEHVRRKYYLYDWKGSPAKCCVAWH